MPHPLFGDLPDIFCETFGDPDVAVTLTGSSGSIVLPGDGRPPAIFRRPVAPVGGFGDEAGMMMGDPTLHLREADAAAVGEPETATVAGEPKPFRVTQFDKDGRGMAVLQLQEV